MKACLLGSLAGGIRTLRGADEPGKINPVERHYASTRRRKPRWDVAWNTLDCAGCFWMGREAESVIDGLLRAQQSLAGYCFASCWRIGEASGITLFLPPSAFSRTNPIKTTEIMLDE